MHAPQSTIEQAFELWIAEAEAPHKLQSPAAELLAEHHVMGAVLTAMEAESERMLSGGSLRPEFWTDVVDFNGNFVHLCHRVKEEEHFIPALLRLGILDAPQDEAIRHEHHSAKRLTLAICDGVAEGDWEKVLRIVSLYLHVLRPHMHREEAGMLLAAAQMPSSTSQELRTAFDLVDQKALAHRGRRHYVEVARRLSAACGIVCNLKVG